MFHLPKIQIVVPCYNRKKITELVLRSIKISKNTADQLVADNDHSSDYNNHWLSQYADKVNLVGDDVHSLPPKQRIAAIRGQHFRNFLNSDYDYLYLTDNDALHSPEWRKMVLELYGKWKLSDGRKLPVTLYNTIHHSQQGNTLMEMDEVLFRKTAPGISQFFDRDMCNLIVNFLEKNPNIEQTYGWDYLFPLPLQRPFITSRFSYVEHFSRDETQPGIHSTFSGQGEAGRIDFERDRALNPTDWLKSIRGDVIEYLLGIKERINIFSD
jgi:glycosyltransferase involved in cell wall biosynthesis